jgi:hypothetical protein
MEKEKYHDIVFLQFDKNIPKQKIAVISLF